MMRIICPLIDYLLGSVSPGSRSRSFSSLRSEIQEVKVGRETKLGVESSRVKQCSSRTDDFGVKGSKASHSHAHMRPLINCFTCSDSQLSQPPRLSDDIIIICFCLLLWVLMCD